MGMLRTMSRLVLTQAAGRLDDAAEETKGEAMQIAELGQVPRPLRGSCGSTYRFKMEEHNAS